jgi:hypothetical protein
MAATTGARTRPPVTFGWMLWLAGLLLFFLAAFVVQTWHGVLLVPLGLLCFAASTRVP